MMRSLLATSVLIASFCGPAAAQAPDLSKLDVVERSVPDGPVARVGDAFISRESYLSLYRQQLAALRMMNPGGQITDGARVMTGIQCLRELLEREVLAREADRLGLEVSEADVLEAYESEVKALQEVLQQQGQGSVTEEDILRQGNQTRESALANIRHELRADRVRAHIVNEQGITIPEDDIRAFYNENREMFRRSGGIHLRQIFIRPRPNAKEATERAWATAREEIDRALARIRAGETFEGVARAMSDAPDAERGGDLGMQPAGQLPTFFIEAAQRLQPGQTSEVIRSEHGLHVVRLEATEQESDISLDDAREGIRAMLMRMQGENAIETYTDPLINDPEHVAIFLRLEDNLALLGEQR